MTQADFISLLQHPESIQSEHISDLKDLVENYPFFSQARMLYLKALQVSGSIHFERAIKTAAVYTSQRRWFYHFLYPEIFAKEVYRRSEKGKPTGSYFDLLNVIEKEGGDSGQTLKNLADQLKKARAMVMENPPVSEKDEPVLKKESIQSSEVQAEYFAVEMISEQEISEESVKQLIKNRKYPEALEILKKLNLNNPKKSVYFADQIRFLEKVIENLKI
jgi:hypothetical protein